MLQKKITIWSLALLVCFLFTMVPFSYTQTENASQVKDLLENLPKYEGEAFWGKVSEIESLGTDIKPAVESGLQNTNPFIRLACAKIIYELDGKPESVVTLLSLLKEEKSKEIKRVASEILGTSIKDDTGYGDKNNVAESIQQLLDIVLEPEVRLNLSRALYYTKGKGHIRGISEIKDLVKAGEAKNAKGELKYPGLRAEAALTLAELGSFEEVRDIIKELAKEPGQNGRLAQAFLDYYQLYKDYNRKSAVQNKYDYSILDEMLNIIKQYYVDPKRFDVDKLITEAAKGIAGSLDKFSGYQDEEEKKLAEEDLNKRYGGIGAYVSMRDDFLTIERPIYSGPAYKANLRSLDKITEVEGVSTRGKSIEELIKNLKGEPGTKVNIKVYRKGWPKEKEYQLTRAIIQIDTARSVILPGDIGFLSILTFGQNTAKEVWENLEKLKKANVKAIIIDLRFNSGGLLSAVCEIVDMFIEKGKVILTTKDKDGNLLGEPYVTLDDNKIDLPVFVLVNDGSASASEILAGVLQDYGKGKLVGGKTFGKGSVQNLWPLKSTNGKTVFRITIAKYYLPSGRCIHKEINGEGGLSPDIEIAQPERDPWKDFAFNKVMESDIVTKYVENNYGKNKELFTRLAEDDSLDYNLYPDFNELYNSLNEKLNIHLSKDDVRGIVWDYVRKQVSDDRGEEFIVNLEEDVQLQRSIIEALNALKIAPETIKNYKNLAHKFDKSEMPPKETPK
ncbi:MAG: S41 family peptidase [Planctomycetes bacterium]|nr:S41 family peptidase [Planctomycetota bacterium]